MSKHIQRKKARLLQDWHPADIKAALEKKGWSLRRLSQHHGYSPAMLSRALARPYPNAERLIASALGVAPEIIWPSRYTDGQPTHRPGGKRAKQPRDATLNVIEELRQRGQSLANLAQQHGYFHIDKVIRRRWPAAERLVADALGMEPWDIWPSRYHPDHTPVRDPRGRRSVLRTPRAEFTTSAETDNVYPEEAE
jgi:Ner family transcriptional regulator